MVMVVVLFLICNIPSLIVNIVETFFEQSALFIHYLTDASNFLLLFNSSVNFVIYYVFSPEFSRLFRYRRKAVPFMRQALLHLLLLRAEAAATNKELRQELDAGQPLAVDADRHSVRRLAAEARVRAEAGHRRRDVEHIERRPLALVAAPQRTEHDVSPLPAQSVGALGHAALRRRQSVDARRRRTAARRHGAADPSANRCGGCKIANGQWRQRPAVRERANATKCRARVGAVGVGRVGGLRLRQFDQRKDILGVGLILGL